MSQSIVPDPQGDTPARVEDKVRALPENQGINESVMWDKIDHEVEEARKKGTLVENEGYQDKHGK